MPKPSLAAIGSLLILALGSLSGFAVTLDQLRATRDLTPEKLASYFAAFDFEFRAEVQSPEVFLASRSGDCDDYATLAALLLSERGYTPRLIAVRMPRVVHVVCYIEETGSYLDYNYRASATGTITSSPDLSSIAASVARSYNSYWTSASEFTFHAGLKRLVSTVLPERDSKIKDSQIASLSR